MMWEAAKRARGRILCVGLGLGIFPQLALSLPRTESVHVVEVDPAIIQLIQTIWKQNPWPRMSECTITRASVEEYLQNTTEKFDTVYIDTWDAIYHEYLPHINDLRRLAIRVLRPGGEVLLWAYDMMVRQFLKTAELIWDRRGNYLKASPAQMKNIRQSYPLLHSLIHWLRVHPKCLNEEFRTTAYQLATQKEFASRMLKLATTKGGGTSLLQSKMAPATST